MRRTPWLVTACLGCAAASASVTVDGSSSDLAQQYYSLHESGYEASALSLATIPSDVQARLGKYSLTFADMPPLLQRALLWDSGYVVAYGDNVTLATIYTPCGNGSTMADIALTLDDYESSGCAARACAEPFDSSVTTYRSLDCTGTQMASVSRCATSDVETDQHSSMWATGGNGSLLPVPNLVRHNWTDSGTSYLIYAIHLVDPEHSYDSCPTRTSASSMIIPCVAYGNATASDWCRPSPGKVVDNWLSVEAGSSSSYGSSASVAMGKSPLTATQSRSPPSLNPVLQSFVESAPANDGTSSDLALQFLTRYAAGNVVPALKFASSDLPAAIQARLTPLSLDFEELDGFLQRALIWDSGYSPAAADNTQLTKIYTKAGRSMADIAVPLKEYLSECTVKTCADQNGGYSNRSRMCNGDQMTPLVYCASSDARDSGLHLSMWGDGGIATDIPNPQVVRHFWNESTSVYLMYAIHTGLIANEPAWDQCTTSNGYYGSMIIPCRSYDTLSSTDKSDWVEPDTGALVAAWLEQARQDSKWGLAFWFSLLCLLILLTILAVGLWLWRKKRQAAASRQDLKLAQLKLQQQLGAIAVTTTAVVERESPLQALGNDPTLVRMKIPMDQLAFDRSLAKGGFGEVWLGSHQQTPVAIKKLLQSKQQLESVKDFIEEIQLTSSFHHPNIIRFLGVAWSKLEDLCMVLEYLEVGDLRIYLERNNKHLSWSNAKFSIALGIASAVAYLHARSPAPLIHRDIKAKNILLTTTLQPKLIDFGVSRDRVQETMTAGIGTPYWAAPEVLEGNRYTEQSDIYSFGVLLSELDTGHTPFNDSRGSSGERLSVIQVVSLVLVGKLEPALTPDCPTAICAIMKECLRLDPAQRPTGALLVEKLKSSMT